MWAATAMVAAAASAGSTAAMTQDGVGALALTPFVLLGLSFAAAVFFFVVVLVVVLIPDDRGRPA